MTSDKAICVNHDGYSGLSKDCPTCSERSSSDKALAIKDYVEAAIEHAMANVEVGADGYYTSHPIERKREEAAFERLIEALSE